MRIRIRDQELRMIDPNGAKLNDLAALQTQTGLKMQQVQDLAAANESASIQMVVFLTLRNSGQFVTWEQAGEYTMGEVDPIEDPIDQVQDDEAAGEADPTSAQTGSALGAAAKAPAAKASSRRSRTRTGSPSLSAVGK